MTWKMVTPFTSFSRQVFLLYELDLQVLMVFNIKINQLSQGER